MFLLVLFLFIVSSLFLRLVHHRTSTSAAPFYFTPAIAAPPPPSTMHSLLSILIPGPFRIRCRAVCRRRDNPFDFCSPFPHLSLSLCSVHCIATDSDSDYKLPKPCFAEKQATVAPSPSRFRLCLCLLVSLAARSDSDYRRSTSPFANPRVSLFRYQLTLRVRLSHRRTPAAVGITTHTHRSQSLSCAFSFRERRPCFILLSAPIELTRGLSIRLSISR